MPDPTNVNVVLQTVERVDSRRNSPKVNQLVDIAIQEGLPQGVPMLGAADGRGAFEARIAVGHVLGGKEEIVRAGLHRHRQHLRL